MHFGMLIGEDRRYAVGRARSQHRASWEELGVDGFLAPKSEWQGEEAQHLSHDTLMRRWVVNLLQSHHGLKVVHLVQRICGNS